MSLSLLKPAIKVPISIDFTLARDFLSSSLSTKTESFSTPHFALPGFPCCQYYLQFTSDNPTDKNGLQIVLIFESKYKNVQIFGEYNFEINEEKYVKTDFEFENYGLHQFVCLNDPNYIFDKSIVINLRGNLFIKSISSNPIFFKGTKENRNLFKNHGGKDFIVRTNGNDLKIHKSILREYSAVFAKKMEEKEYYEIFEFDNKIVKTIINLCYGVTPKTPLIIEEYAQLLSFAIKYEMEYIKSVIKASIVLTPQNICEYSNLAVKHGCIEFFDECFDYLIICLQYSYPIKNFDALNADIKDLLAERID